MKELWERIESWLKENHSEGLNELNEGASDELIQETEQFLSIEFSEDVKEFYKIHNGTSWDFNLIDGWLLLPLEDVQNQWKVWKDLLDRGDFAEHKCTPHEAIRDDWWNDKWIPLTSDGCGNHDCLDLAPTEKGRVGQIIKMWHDDDTRPLVADSFREWLENYIDALEASEYVYSEDYGGIVSVDDI